MASTNLSAIAPVSTVNAINASSYPSAKADGSGVAFKNLLDISASSDRSGTNQTLKNKNAYTLDSNTVTRAIKQADSTKPRDSDIKDIKNDITDAITKTVTKDLDITDEQFSDIMQMLGITAIELLQPDNLAIFYATVNGTDNVQEVILNSDFTNVLNDLSLVSSDYSEKLQILSEMETVNTTKTSDILANITSDDIIAQQTVKEEVASSDKTFEVEISDILPEDNTAKAIDNQEKSNLSQDDFTGNDSKGNSTDILKQSDNEPTNILHTTSNEMSFNEVIDTLPRTEVSNVKIDTMDIIRQIAERISISCATAEDSTIQMQLNPENLGKIYINVTERNSEITARIAVSNEAVREALSTQMVELKEALNNSGIRVNEVEVTVASHEFEQNLEQNATSDDQRQNEQNLISSKSALGTDGSSASIDIPTEESLAQRIMKDNGNSVDFTA